jgi:hypothetical protein
MLSLSLQAKKTVKISWNTFNISSPTVLCTNTHQGKNIIFRKMSETIRYCNAHMCRFSGGHDRSYGKVTVHSITV